MIELILRLQTLKTNIERIKYNKIHKENMVKQAVKVLIRARPTANFASQNIKLDPIGGTIGVSLDPKKKEEGGFVNNQTDSWKFKFDKILNNAT